ncbi:Fe(3+) ABC transporter substrate-binding protein [Curvivirga aplysinae]|uniref:Fe(3+) ABC transporter substrate-binding protein n=1 Tax=Curvivirga aplysinae TaxID=2529852 RepID=UPI0012BBA2FA|nr:Fe(3+) ABC transporter substrate-binding protein [Curvivirga aplysinae]MTI09179.1 Fe(3+) ABC transporter substrate-binding protein [Curvivirga aplysinae]
MKKDLLGLGAAIAIAAVSIAGLMKTSQAAEEVNVYSYRQPFLIDPMFDAFTKETGIAVNVVYAKKGLEQRIKQEGPNSPADLIMSVDIGRLSSIVNKGLTQPVESEILETAIPANLRSTENQWFALTTRARIVYASKDRVPEGDLTTYEDLADPKFKGRICTRAGNHSYNLALIASMIDVHGEAKTEEWLKGLKANLARKPQGNDRAQVKAIWQGECDLSIGNTYYMGKMMSDKKQIEWANSVRIIFPNQEGRGTHINVSGVSMAKYAPNRENAQKLMEFLVSDKAQALYAELNFEYPVKEGVEWSPVVNTWGQFKTDDISLDTIASLRDEASKLIDKVGFNE